MEVDIDLSEKPSLQEGLTSLETMESAASTRTGNSSPTPPPPPNPGLMLFSHFQFSQSRGRKNSPLRRHSALFHRRACGLGPGDASVLAEV